MMLQSSSINPINGINLTDSSPRIDNLKTQRRIGLIEAESVLISLPSRNIPRSVNCINLLILGLVSLTVVLTDSHAKEQEPLKLGKCDPVNAVKTLDRELKKGKTLDQAMTMVIKNKQFDGSNACITFIRESAMQNRESAPNAFKKLWLQ